MSPAFQGDALLPHWITAFRDRVHPPSMIAPLCLGFLRVVAAVAPRASNRRAVAQPGATSLDGRSRPQKDRAHPMLWRALVSLGLCVVLAFAGWARLDAQRAGAFMGSPDDPGDPVLNAPVNNDVVDVNRKLRDGTVRFAFEGRSGFLAVGARRAADSG